MFKTRDDKPFWIVNNFANLFKSARNILDIGCDNKQLQKHLIPSQGYFGIDKNKKADISLDFDKEQPLPVKDGEFELVVCLDVLEHLENIHFIFDELCRMSSRDLLVSLPNNLQAVIWGYWGRKKTYTKFYGLPNQKPSDRHRWFFNSEEAKDFVTYVANKNGFKLIDIVYEVDKKSLFKKCVLFIICGFNRNRLLKFFSGTTFFSLKKI